MPSEHIPVLFEAVVKLLRPKNGGRYIDGTVGAGGHAAGLLELSAPDGRLLALDRDRSALAYAAGRLASYGERVTYVHANFSAMAEVAPAAGFDDVDGILLDLGLSSRQLADGGRGFSFDREGPLDMRFNQEVGLTAAELINGSTEEELADIFWRYGEERRSRRIAQAIVQRRPVHSTRMLAGIVADVANRRRGKHPATKVFQALRIAVNEELAAIGAGLPAALTLLRAGGRLAVIGFHSLEDRLVKQTFRQWSLDCTCPATQPVCTCDGVASVRLITRRAVKAASDEVAANPRSRSARLRVVERLGQQQ